MKNRIINASFIFIGIYQVFAGIFGLSAVFKQSLLFIFQHFLGYVLVIGFFVYSIICGIYLFKSSNLKRGVKLSIINQALQLLQFEVLGNGLYYVAGSYFAIGFSDAPKYHVLLDYSLFRSSCYLSFLTESNEITIALNVVAFIFLAFLFYLNKMQSTDEILKVRK